LRVQGLSTGVQDSGGRALVLQSLWSWALSFGLKDFGLRGYGLGVRSQGSFGFVFSGFRLRVQGLRCRV